MANPPAPPQWIKVGAGSHSGMIPNPAYQDWLVQYGPNSPNQYGGNYSAGVHAGPTGSTPQFINGQWYYVSSRTGFKSPIAGVKVMPYNGANYYVSPDGTILGLYTADSSGGNQNPQISYSGSGGGMTAYESAQIALDQQKLAQAEAQQKADEEYRQAQALDAFNKNWQDFQTKNYYGSIAGPAYAAPAGAPNWWKMPEPDYVANYYKNNPGAGPDPWSQPNPYSGYSGSLFSNPQQPGTQQTPPTGALAAPVAAGAGQAVQGPFPGVTSGQLPTYNPNAPQSGQNVPPSSLGGTKPPIIGGGASGPPIIAPGGGGAVMPRPLPVQGMAFGGQAVATQLAVVHGGEQLIEPKTIGATSIPIPQKRPTPSVTSPTYNPGYSIPGMADGGTIPGQPGQPQLAALPAGASVIPGGNFSDNNPSPVANAGPDSMNPIIKQLLGAVNAIITSPEFQSAVYTKPPLPGSSTDGSDTGGGDDSTPPGLASGWPPAAGTYDPNTYRPGSVPGTWMDVVAGVPVPAAQVGAIGLPTAKPVIGPLGGFGGGGIRPSGGGPRPLPGPWPGGGITPPPISAGDAARQSGVVAGPAAINHVPYGPELTGMSGFGGLITPNGTPVVASEWQRQHLDPTSLSRYENYAGTIAGVNPADLKQQSDIMTGGLNENSPTIKPPIRFDLSNQIPVPGQGGG